ncbi:hypothetical protein B9G55_17885 [Saccharibacillus sp. O16]|nr:hypothetical protein B9G55_17885 [Saccharibacillus sp. O16]
MKKRRFLCSMQRPCAIGAIGLFLLLMLSACGGIPQSQSQESVVQVQQAKTKPSPDDVILVEVVIESDSDSAANVKAEINARKNPQSASYDTVQVPYRETFEVSKDAFIPLPSVRFQADAAQDADWISCTIFYDGEEVATHTSRGDQAQAVCEKKFHLGPG